MKQRSSYGGGLPQEPRSGRGYGHDMVPEGRGYLERFGPGGGYDGPYDDALRRVGGDAFGRDHGPRHIDFDPDYRQWRDEQMRLLDEDYRSWREERYKKFAEDFGQWRSSRSRK